MLNTTYWYKYIWLHSKWCCKICKLWKSSAEHSALFSPNFCNIAESRIGSRCNNNKIKWRIETFSCCRRLHCQFLKKLNFLQLQLWKVNQVTSTGILTIIRKRVLSEENNEIKTKFKKLLITKFVHQLLQQNVLI